MPASAPSALTGNGRAASVLRVWLTLFMVVVPLSLGLTSTLFFPLLTLWILGAAYTFRFWPPRIGLPERAWVMFIVLSANAALFGLTPAHSLLMIWNKDFYFLVYALLAATVARLGVRDRLVLLFWWSSVVAGLLGIVQWISAVWIQVYPDGTWAHLMAQAPHGVRHVMDLWSGRSVGPRSHPIRYSEDLLFAVALSVAFLGTGDGRQRWVWLIGAWVMCFAILLSQTRGTWIAVAVVMLVGLLVNRRRLSVHQILLTLVPVLFLVGAGGLRHRMASIGNHDFNIERVEMWHAGWHVIEHHPVWGTGPGTTKLSTRAEQPPEIVKEGGWGHLHNTYITLAADRGLVGLAAFLVLMSAFVIGLRRQLHAAHEDAHKALCRGAFLGWLGFLLCGMTEMDYNNADVAITFYVVMGLALSRAASAPVP